MKTKEIIEFRKTYKPYEKVCVFDGYKLAVLFDEKEMVKAKFARWDEGEQTWWIPAGRLKENDGIGPGSIHEWLNNNKMIVGQYGTFDHGAYNEVNDQTANQWTDKWVLEKVGDNDKDIKFYNFPSLDMVRIDDRHGNQTHVHTEKARSKWEDFVKLAGYTTKKVYQQDNTY